MNKYSGISITNGFKVIGKGLPIDDRLILSKEEMAKTLMPPSKENPLPYYMPDNYFAICSDDGKLYIYDRNNNPPSAETGYFKLMDSETNNTVWQGVRLAGESDLEAITRIVGTAEVHNGDIVILRTLIESDKYSYKSFVFNTVWKAMDGNYDAENVYFRDDMIAAGLYENVGNITLGDTIPAAGKSVKELFNAIFTKEINPDTIQPSIDSTSFSGEAKEVGTKLVPSYSISLDPGSYTYGPETGVTASSYSAIDSNSNILTTPTGSFPELTVSDNLDYYINFSISHTAGNIPVTNLGNNYDAGKIQAGTLVELSEHISGFRSYFYGSVITPQEVIDSDFIRSLTNSGAKLNDTETIIESMQIVENARLVIIAFPSNSDKALLSVKDTGMFNTDIVSCFTKQIVLVEGANGYASINYDVYTYTPATTLNKNIYRVIIG